jgi:hypothetical protein
MEWHRTFGSGAIAALENIWVTKKIKTPAGQKKYAMHMLGLGLSFTYLSFNSKKKVRRVALCWCAHLHN